MPSLVRSLPLSPTSCVCSIFQKGCTNTVWTWKALIFTGLRIPAPRCLTNVITTLSPLQDSLKHIRLDNLPDKPDISLKESYKTSDRIAWKGFPTRSTEYAYLQGLRPRATRHQLYVATRCIEAVPYKGEISQASQDLENVFRAHIKPPCIILPDCQCRIHLRSSSSVL